MLAFLAVGVEGRAAAEVLEEEVELSVGTNELATVEEGGSLWRKQGSEWR